MNNALSKALTLWEQHDLPLSSGKLSGLRQDHLCKQLYYWHGDPKDIPTFENQIHVMFKRQDGSLYVSEELYHSRNIKLFWKAAWPIWPECIKPNCFATIVEIRKDICPMPRRNYNGYVSN